MTGLQNFIGLAVTDALNADVLPFPEPLCNCLKDGVLGSEEAGAAVTVSM